jgi:hypothetical protein
LPIDRGGDVGLHREGGERAVGVVGLGQPGQAQIAAQRQPRRR